MRRAGIVLIVCIGLMGCRAADERRVERVVLTPPPAAPLRMWGHPAELTGRTIDEISAMNIGCTMMIKPESRIGSMRMLFSIYEQCEGKPYLHEIVTNWLSTWDMAPIIRDRQIMFRTCEDQWQWGDLNADGTVDYEDYAIYAEYHQP